jgi:Leucine rich repeat
VFSDGDGTALDERGNTTKAGIATCDQEGRITALVLPTNGLRNWIPNHVIVDALPKLQTLDTRFPYHDPDTGWSAFYPSEPIQFPSEIGRLTELQILAVAGCEFNGTLPSGIWNSLTNLKYLDMPLNYIEGTLPTELGKLTQLQHLNFRENLLTGPIPIELGRLSSLRQLTLDSNQLTGRLPPSFGAWGTSLEYVDLSRNQLTGSLPESYAN